MVDDKALRQCFGLFATGVMIASCHNQEDDQLYGLTINSFSSVSLEPPLLLFSIGNDSKNLEIFKNSSSYSLNILSESQQDLAIGFAKPNNLDKWNIEEYSITKSLNPIFKNSLGFFECIHHNIIKAGDHHIFVGEIKDFKTLKEDKGLFYYMGQFC